ncbi:MAG: CRTAC1 family protein, partial [Bacteroidota bacterium]
MRTLIFLLLLALCYGCGPSENTLFTPIAGIDFANTIPENDSVNIIVFEYIYNGGGVGVGDFDQDGNPDLVFSGNYVSSRLYLQKNSWEFTDVTETAGLTTEVWCSGVNVADVDGNGWEDIYFTTLNPSGEKDTPNLLYLNQGTNAEGSPTFIEAAAEYGLDDRSYGIHSAWFDYENDGDLDLYLLNNAIEQYNRNVAKGTDTTGRGKSVDRIYRNENNRFANTEEIQTEGWGLGVAVQDFNFDGFADIYVANDFLSNDFLLINQEGKGFRDELRERLPHQSRNSMGIDVADLTGDGQPEIMVVDMLPDDNRRVKTMFGDIPHQGDRTERQRGYAQQYIRNTLQLNNGDGTFSDIAFQAGVAATDWSWTPLLADFDNDGDRDIYVSNGYPKDITNKDFIDFSDQATQFGTRESQLKTVMEALAEVEGVHQPNYFFRNDGELQFTEADWLPEEPTYSNGGVFVDLDRDGDLDLVTNNINEPAGLYRNNLRERAPESAHYLLLDLEGPTGNPDALGTKVWLSYGDTTHYHDHYRQRGYLSTVDQLVHFGLGRNTKADKLVIQFPDETGKTLTDVPVDQVLTVAWEPGLSPIMAPSSAHKKAALTAVPLINGPVHQESSYSDFDAYALALRDKSRNGPALAAIDLEGDGIDELVFGGAAGQPVTIWKQETNGPIDQNTNTALTQVQSLGETEQSEAVFIKVGDADQDGYDDVYIYNDNSELGSPAAAEPMFYYRGGSDGLVLSPAPFSFGPKNNISVYEELTGDETMDEILLADYQDIRFISGPRADTTEI